MTAPKEQRHLQDVSQKTEFIPSWERSSLRSALGGTEETKTKSLEARVSPSRYRAVQKLVQQRILGEIETQSDVVQAGVGMVLDYARLHGKDSDDFRKACDVSSWESEIEAILAYEVRIAALLDRTERGLKDAKTRNQNEKFVKLFTWLNANKDGIEDEGLRTRAQKLWVLYREHRKSIK